MWCTCSCASATPLDWQRLVERTGPHWPLLLAQVLIFFYVYPGYRGNVPDWVVNQLFERARANLLALDGAQFVHAAEGRLIVRRGQLGADAPHVDRRTLVL